MRRAGYAVSGSPVNIAVGRTMRLALARRIALRRPSPQAIALLEGKFADCEEVEGRAALRREIAAVAPHGSRRVLEFSVKIN